MDIVSWTFANDDYDQDKPLYIDSTEPTRYLSARQTRKTVRQLVAGFHSHGLMKGDCVCIISFNDIYYTSLFLGIVGAGGRFTGANPGYTSHELAHHLRITEAKYVITQMAKLATATTAADECGIPHSNIFILDVPGEDEPKGCQSWKCLLLHGETNWVTVEDPNNTTAAYFSTSGTSGLPKAAVQPHSFLVAQSQIQADDITPRQKASYLAVLPPFHAFAFPVQHSIPLRKGVAMYLMPRFEPEEFMKGIEQFQISRILVVPPILMAMSKSKLCTQKSLKSLRRIFVSGSAAKDGMQQQFYRKLHPAARIEHVYGMTEVGWAASTRQSRRREQTGSVGTPLPGLKLRLVDQDNHVLEVEGETGEIHIWSNHLMQGYHNNEKASTEAFSADGWVKSGDVGYIKDGKWYVVDRTKDLIKVRGWQVSPAEIECALVEHPEILDAAVIGIAATGDDGEVPQAFIIRKPGSNIEEKDIKAFLATRLSRYKAVEKVEFVSSIPRNPTGKILRRILRDSIRTEQASMSDEEVAVAYKEALRDLEESQQQRDCGVCSRTRSLSDTSRSTIETSGPSSPRSIDVITLVGESESKGKKRRCDISPGEVSTKRRSPRNLVIKVA